MGVDLAEYLTRPSAPPKPDVLRALEQPIHPSHALRLAELDRLLDPAPLAAETGWCWTPEHVAYVAVRTEMPGNSSQMWDWWFDWHPRESLRYRLWCPQAHFGISFTPPPGPRAKPFWGATHYPDEDIGVGRQVIRIEFLAPEEYGFSTNGLDDPAVGTVVGGYTGSQSRHVRLGVVTHVFLNRDDGLVLRSRFWIGVDLRPDLPGALGGAAGRLLNHPAVRRRVLPRELPSALARHCAHEYARLGALLPELHSGFA